MQCETLVELRNVVKIYDGNPVLKKVNFDLKAGEIHCLVGENGAGKSTLIKILSGAVTPDSGEIFAFGKVYKSLHPKQAIQLGISTVHQDSEVVDSLTVAENIFLGSEISIGRIPVVNRKQQNEEAKRIIKMLGTWLPPDELGANLSTAQKQILQIAKALLHKAKVIILDEPTSSLGLEETRSLFSILNNLKNQGIGIIYISHHLREIFEIGDRVTILKDGEHVGTYYVNEVTVDDIARKMVGRDVALFYKRRPVKIGRPVLRVSGLTRLGVVSEVTFDVREGEIFGLGGLVGSGRTELVSLIYGLDKPDSGEIFIDGQKVKIESPEEAIRCGICFISEDRHKYGLLRERGVLENTVIIKNKLSKNFMLRLSQEIKDTAQIAERLSLVFRSYHQPVKELSGGNQQKVIIGRWLLTEDRARIFIFDDPTKGVDIGARQQIYEAMLQIAESGKAIIMISSDMPELLSMSDRIGVMRKGKLVAVLDNRDRKLKEEELIRLFVGVE